MKFPKPKFKIGDIVYWESSLNELNVDHITPMVVVGVGHLTKSESVGLYVVECSEISYFVITKEDLEKSNLGKLNYYVSVGYEQDLITKETLLEANQIRVEHLESVLNMHEQDGGSD